MDPSSPLSPFSQTTRSVRDASIEVFREVADGSELTVSELIRPHLPEFLWLIQMALIFYWMHDGSPGQRQTEKLTAATSQLVGQLLPMTTLPFMDMVVGPIVKVFEESTYA